MTTLSGYMTPYGGRSVCTVWRENENTRSPRPSPARRELCAGTRHSPRIFSVGSAKSVAGFGERQSGCRTIRRPNQGFSNQSSLLRSERTQDISAALDRAGGDTPAKGSQSASPPKTYRKEDLKLTARSTLEDVAAVVGEALRRAGIRAVLTGGGCATIYTAGDYKSEDLDFILQATPSQRQLDQAMATVGYRRKVDQYFHSRVSFFVEFPSPPLGIGKDIRISPVERNVRGSRVLALSPTDSCRDRLAAFFHWHDRQALQTAVEIAIRHRVNLGKIRDWSAEEGATAGFEEFLRELGRIRRVRRKIAR